MFSKPYPFSKDGLKIIEGQDKSKDWPVVYLIYNDTDLYIGETTSMTTRMIKHLATPEKQHLSLVMIDYDGTYNKSVILDFEQKLIKYYSVDKKFKNILNKNAGQSSTHDYYERKNYYNTFRELWNNLYKNGMTNNPIDKLENQKIFKYSPYNSLTEEQNLVSVDIINDICEKFENRKTGISLINGGAGTGKTVLAISIINSLVNAINLNEHDLSEDAFSQEKVNALLRVKAYVKKNHKFKIGFVFPMTGMRGTIEKVFTLSGNGLHGNMVISPYKLKDEEYDILFVDESHRLKQRKNLSSPQEYVNFDNACKSLSLDPQTATQLEWVLKRAKYTVLFYDENQTIKSTDITLTQFQNTISNSGTEIKKYNLYKQMRCKGGLQYIEYVNNILNCVQKDFKEMKKDYQFCIFDDVDVMIKKIQEKDNDSMISKTVSGYSWEWKTKPDKKPKDNIDYYNYLVDQGKYDIDINGNRYIWNFVTDDWISRQDSHNTIGCIHSTQGSDLNYVGIIFGKEIDYNPETNTIDIDIDKFCDVNVKRGCDENTIKRYIMNAYKTMMVRGIDGCYVYAYNKNLQNYLEQFLKKGD